MRRRRWKRDETEREAESGWIVRGRRGCASFSFYICEKTVRKECGVARETMPICCGNKSLSETGEGRVVLGVLQWLVLLVSWHDPLAIVYSPFTSDCFFFFSFQSVFVVLFGNTQLISFFSMLSLEHYSNCGHLYSTSILESLSLLMFQLH